MPRPRYSKANKDGSSSATTTNSPRSLVVGLLLGLCLGISLSEFYGFLGMTTGGAISAYWKGATTAAKNSFLAKSSSNTTSSSSSSSSSEDLHILFGMSGTDAGFFLEFQVSLKSILLNAPHQRKTHIHIMADEEAYTTLYHNYNHTGKGVFDTIQMDNIDWYQDIYITTYNVQRHLSNWTHFIQKTVRHPYRPSTESCTVGAYFRLFPQDILPPDIGDFVLYLDTDVAVLANLADILRYKDPTYTFVMSERCSGVMWVNLKRLSQFWQFVSKVEWKEEIRHDQILINGVADAFPNDHIVKTLPPTWDLKVASHWQHRTREQLIAFRPNGIGMFHYNGLGKIPGSAFHVHSFVEYDWAKDGWGIPALFYRELPWEWVKFMGQSVVADERSSHGMIRIQRP